MKDHKWENTGSVNPFKGHGAELFIWVCKNCNSIVASYDKPIVCEQMVMVNYRSVLNGDYVINELKAMNFYTGKSIKPDCNFHLVNSVMND